MRASLKSLAPDRETLYSRLPVLLQNWACSVEGLRVHRQRYNKSFAQILAEYESRSSWTDDQVQEFRDERLRTFVQVATATVSLYAHRFRDAGVNPASVRTLDDLRSIAPIEKDEARTIARDSRYASHRDADIIHTSGTTGAGLRFPTQRRAAQEQWAVWWRYRRWHGINLDQWCAYFGGRSVVPISQDRAPLWRINTPGRQILFSGYHMSDENLRLYAEELRRRKLLWLHGYPSLIVLLASYVLSTGFDLGYQCRWITTGAENLSPQQSRLIQDAFGVPPIQHYGMAEAAANVSECENGSLHVDEDFAALELVKKHDGTHHLLGTNFTNPYFPLIRYVIGDIATPDGSGCPCGRWGRVLQSIDGRAEDYVLLPSGARVGRLDHVFKDMVSIREAQIVQRSLDRISIRVVPAPTFVKEDQQALLMEARKRLGNQIHIEIDVIDEIPRTTNGKLRLVVSELEPTE